jgi:hypothetical protein
MDVRPCTPRSSPGPITALASSPTLKPSIFYEETVRSRVLQENLNPALNSYGGLVEKRAPPTSTLRSPTSTHPSLMASAHLTPFPMSTPSPSRPSMPTACSSGGKWPCSSHSHNRSHIHSPRLGWQPQATLFQLKGCLPNTPCLPKAALRGTGCCCHHCEPDPLQQARQHILGGLFWLPAHPSASRQWDAEKVHKVLDGSAVIKVIDVDHLHPRLQ